MAQMTLQQLADIEDIRQLTVNYARATDLLGSDDEHKRSQGRALYHVTFAPDAKVRAGESEEVTGPDAWADYVMNALRIYSSTQHLVGTIDIHLDPAAQGPASTATMTTYLYATHEHAPGGDIWIVLGTYHDQCTRTAEGWRIATRQLRVTSSEMRRHP